MAVVTNAAFQMTDASFLIGADEHTSAFSSVAIQTTYPSSSWTNIGGETTAFQGAPTRRIVVTYAQDWLSETSTSVYLFEHEGDTATVTFTPQDGGRPFTATVQLSAGDIGGGVGSAVEATATFPIRGALTMGDLP